MKKILLVILLLFVCSESYSQSSGKQYLRRTYIYGDSSGYYVMKPLTSVRILKDLRVDGGTTFDQLLANDITSNNGFFNLSGNSTLDAVTMNTLTTNDSTVLGGQVKYLKGTGTATTGSDGDTINGSQLVLATTVSLTTAGLATYTFTLNSNLIRTGSSLLITLSTASAGVPLIQSYVVSGSRATIKIFNAAAVTALNAPITLNILILN